MLTFVTNANEVFGDIMVLTLPPQLLRLPIDPDDVNARICFEQIPFKFDMRVDTHPPEVC